MNNFDENLEVHFVRIHDRNFSSSKDSCQRIKRPEYVVVVICIGAMVVSTAPVGLDHHYLNQVI